MSKWVRELRGVGFSLSNRLHALSDKICEPKSDLPMAIAFAVAKLSWWMRKLTAMNEDGSSRMNRLDERSHTSPSVHLVQILDKFDDLMLQIKLQLLEN